MQNSRAKKRTFDVTHPFSLLFILCVFFAFNSHLLFNGKSNESVAQLDEYVPLSDATIVLNLSPAIVSLSRQIQSREMRDRAGRGTTRDTRTNFNSGQLLNKILSTYQIAATSGDPRAYGHSLGLIEKWPENLNRPTLLMLIEAAIEQHQHQFSSAQSKLQQILLLEPNNQQARVMLSQIALVIGDYALVAEQCSAMQFANRGVQTFESINCNVQLQGVTGAAAAALDRVLETLELSGLTPVQSFELQVSAAGLATRLGHFEDAISYYRSALNLQPSNSYALVQLANLLIDIGEMEQAAQLLSPPIEAGSTNAELKLLFARARDAARPADGQISPQSLLLQIRDEISATIARGEPAPAKLSAQLALYIDHDYLLAEEYAAANWQVQKEPSDILLLARAAAASKNQNTLAMIASWVSHTGLEDVMLLEVLTQEAE